MITILMIAVLIVVFGYLLQFGISIIAVLIVVFGCLLQFGISIIAVLMIAVLIVVFGCLLQFGISIIESAVEYGATRSDAERRRRCFAGACLGVVAVQYLLGDTSESDVFRVAYRRQILPGVAVLYINGCNFDDCSFDCSFWLFIAVLYINGCSFDCSFDCGFNCLLQFYISMVAVLMIAVLIVVLIVYCNFIYQ